MLTPRPYLSWTALNMVETSPAQWVKTYLYGERIPINRGMAFGKKMADGLESGELTGDIFLDVAMAQLPKFEIMDKEFRVEMKSGKEKIELLCKPDTMRADMSAFKEYKTGKTPWTQKKVDGFGQLTFYATGMYLKTGHIPKDIELVHVPTESQLDEKIAVTGVLLRYPTTRNMADILKMMARISKAWAKIKILTESELL